MTPYELYMKKAAARVSVPATLNYRAMERAADEVAKIPFGQPFRRADQKLHCTTGAQYVLSRGGVRIEQGESLSPLHPQFKEKYRGRLRAHQLGPDDPHLQGIRFTPISSVEHAPVQGRDLYVYKKMRKLDGGISENNAAILWHRGEPHVFDIRPKGPERPHGTSLIPYADYIAENLRPEAGTLSLQLGGLATDAIKKAGLLRARYLAGQMPKDFGEVLYRFLRAKGRQIELPNTDPRIIVDMRHPGVLHAEIRHDAGYGTFTVDHKDPVFNAPGEIGIIRTEREYRQRGLADKTFQLGNALFSAVGAGRAASPVIDTTGAIERIRVRHGWEPDARYPGFIARDFPDSPAVARDRGRFKQARDPHAGKRVYLTRDEASRAAKSHAFRTGDHGLHPYPCKLGDHWHLGHRH